MKSMRFKLAFTCKHQFLESNDSEMIAALLRRLADDIEKNLAVQGVWKVTDRCNNKIGYWLYDDLQFEVDNRRGQIIDPDLKANAYERWSFSA